MTYAGQTSVSVAKTRAEIEELVQRQGGKSFGVMLDDTKAVVVFELADRRVMFELPLPNRADFAMKKGRYGYQTKVPAAEQHTKWEQACRTRWRALFLTIKAKLVSVESGVESFEEAFLAQVVVSDEGRLRRFGDIAIKAIARSYSGEGLPPLLGAGE